MDVKPSMHFCVRCFGPSMEYENNNNMFHGIYITLSKDSIFKKSCQIDDFGNFYENYEEYIGVDCISNFLAYLIKDKTDCVYSILDLKSWNYGEEEWGGMPRLGPEYRGVKEKSWLAGLFSKRLNDVGYEYLRQTILLLPEVDSAFWDQFDKVFLDNFIWNCISLMHDQCTNEALEESVAELDWWSCEACKDWLNLAVVLNIRSERAAEMLKAMPEE